MAKLKRATASHYPRVRWCCYRSDDPMHRITINEEWIAMQIREITSHPKIYRVLLDVPGMLFMFTDPDYPDSILSYVRTS